MNEENKLTFTLNDPNGGLTEFSKPSQDTVITFEEVFDISWLFFDLLKIFRTLMFCCSKKVNLPKNKKSCWNVYHLVNCRGSGARPWGCNVLKPGAGSNQVPFPRPLVERCAARPSYPGQKPVVSPQNGKDIMFAYCMWDLHTRAIKNTKITTATIILNILYRLYIYYTHHIFGDLTRIFQ